MTKKELTNKDYQNLVDFFVTETHMTERNAKKCAAYVDNICFNVNNYSDFFVDMVAMAVRNGVFIGQEMGYKFIDSLVY